MDSSSGSAERTLRRIEAEILLIDQELAAYRDLLKPDNW